jgi:hypothetical protein
MYVMPSPPAGTTIYFPFDSYDSNGASVTITGLAVTDVEIYKNGSVTQRASDNGIALLDTDGIDFDGTTGLHGFSIDLSDNSDVGFYAAGAQYWVNVNAVTIDAQTVRFTYYFRIVAAETTAGYPDVTVNDFTTAAKALLETEANDAIVANNLDHLLKVAVDTNFATTVQANSVIGHLADNGAGYDRTTDSLEAADADRATIETSMNAVITALFDGSLVAGTLSAAAKAEVQAEATAALVAYDPPTHAELTSGLASADDATLAAIAALNNLSSAQAQTAAAAALTAYGGPTNAQMEARTLVAAGYATAASITALNNVSTSDVTTSVTTALTTALTEGYRATNATGSVRDILYEVLSVLTQASITTTTLTGYKLDGTTVAKTYTLNSAVTPTSITETT